MNVEHVANLAQRLQENVSRVIIGKEHEIKLVLTAMLSGGHVLLEDVPGTGKTTLAKSLAKSLTCGFARVQFTPDLLPADVTGMRVYNQHSGEFNFIKGPALPTSSWRTRSTALRPEPSRLSWSAWRKSRSPRAA